ncbi:ankyrin repeat domain-containing protein [Brachybacterium huguangmaarense]
MTTPSIPDPSGRPDDPAGTPSDDDAIALAHAMFDACRTGEGAGVLPLIDAGAPASMRDADGNSLLMLAAYHGHADLVRELARRGADVDALNDRGQSPLAGAAFKGFDEVASALLEAGADPEAGEPSGRASAAFFGREAIAAMIRDAAPGAPDQDPGTSA